LRKPVSSVALGDVAELNPKINETIQPETQVSFVPMAAVTEVTGEITIEEIRQYADVVKGFTPFKSDDIIVAKITPCFQNGKIAYAKLSRPYGFGSTEFHVIRADTKRLLPRYVFHFLRQDYIRIAGERRMTGSAGQRRVPLDYLASLELPLPPLSEQKRIAEILDCAEALRSKRRAALALLDELTQSIFLDMFGDPVTNPKGWEFKSLENLLTDGPQNGLYKPGSDYGSGTPILRIDAFYDGTVNDIETLKRVRLTDQERTRYALTENDVVINRVNSVEYLGKSALIPHLSEDTVFESNMMRMRFNSSVVHQRFIIAILQTEFVKQQILGRAKRAVNQASINQQDVKSIQVVVPPLKLQRHFVDFCSTIENQATKYVESLAEFDQLFASLQHRAFRGEL